MILGSWAFRGLGQVREVGLPMSRKGTKHGGWRIEEVSPRLCARLEPKSLRTIYMLCLHTFLIYDVQITGIGSIEPECNNISLPRVEKL